MGETTTVRNVETKKNNKAASGQSPRRDLTQKKVRLLDIFGLDTNFEWLRGTCACNVQL